MSTSNSHTAMEEHLTEYQLSVAADALMEGTYETLDVSISQHIETCSTCKSDLLSLVDVLNQLDANQETKPLNKSNFSWSTWLVAASFLLLLFTTVFFWKNSHQYQAENLALHETIETLKTDSLSTSSDSLQTEIEQYKQNSEAKLKAYLDSLDQLSNQLESTSQLLAKAYTVNPSFERQLEIKLRAGSVEVNSPKNLEANYGDQVKLSWKNEDSSPAGFALYNNKGLLILKETEVTNSYLLNSELVTPGVYYWKLIHNKDVVFIGKITLK